MRLRDAFIGSALLIAFSFAVAALWSIPGTVAAADSLRQVEVPRARKVDPMVVTKVTLGNDLVQGPNYYGGPAGPTPFRANDDWIQNLAIHFLNRTDLTIVYANILVGYPETTAGGTKPLHVSILNLGRIPDGLTVDKDGKLHEQRPDAKPLFFGPDQTLVVRLGDHMDQIASSRLPLSALTQVKIILSSCYFANGMRFAGNSFSTFDPRNPGHWQSLGLTYFPGDPSRNWPRPPALVDGKEIQ